MGYPEKKVADRGLVTKTGRLRAPAVVAAVLAGIIILILAADQILKVYVKTHFYLGEGYEITPWFVIKFIQNNGMAFGMELVSKYLLTFGRTLAVVFLIWALFRVLPCRKLRMGFLISMALIIAGAFGNVIDCIFYGKLFSDPFPPEVATMLPEGAGYAGWFEGRVVDMLYFPLFTFTWPDWVPGVGGQQFEFFQYIFNIADAAITVGVLMLLFFYSSDLGLAWKYLQRSFRKDTPEEEETADKTEPQK